MNGRGFGWSESALARWLIALPRSRKAVLMLCLDIALVPLAMMLVALVFGRGTGVIGGWPLLLGMMALAGVGSIATGLWRLRLKEYPLTGPLRSLVIAATLGAVAGASTGSAQLSEPLLLALLYSLLQGGARQALARVMAALYRRSRIVSRVAIYGASPSGIALSRALMDRAGIVTCAFLDENPALRGAQLNGLPVLPPAAAHKLPRDFNIDRVILADPALAPARLHALTRRLEGLGLRVESLPAFAEICAQGDLAAQLAPVSGASLSRREELDDALLPVRAFYHGKTVLVSGAGGSIGLQLCREILQTAPRRLILLEFSEPALYRAEAELRALAAGSGADHLVPVLGSAADARLLRGLFRREQVEVVVHAAAYKHVPIVEANPRAGIANNVFATLRLARAAREAGAERFVLVSSDKAVAPCSVMGASKRIAELIVQDLASRPSETVFSIVRFGNVLGSSGSVVPLFEEQIRNGGPVTVTDRRATRYFMSVTEAARLVLLAGAWRGSGGVYALDMGHPVRIEDLARQMIEARGYRLRDAATPEGDVEIIEIGLRPGEKLHEARMTGAGARPTAHPKIVQVDPPHPCELGTAALLRDLRAALEAEEDAALRAVLARVMGAAEAAPGSQSQAVVAGGVEPEKITHPAS